MPVVVHRRPQGAASPQADPCAPWFVGWAVDHRTVTTRVPAFVGRRNWRPVFDRALRQGGVLTLNQLADLGVTRSEVANHLRAARWRRVANQVIALSNGPVSDHGARWAAVLHTGSQAQLDGVSSLVASGLERFTTDEIRVSVPHGHRVRPPGPTALPLTDRWLVCPTRRWAARDCVPTGLPRTRPAIAAVRGAVWAASDKQAALLLSMVVQQRLATPEQLGRELLRIERAKRREFLSVVIGDLLDGAQALGELDIARLLRRRGLPPPSRQVVRKGRNGRYYLDLYWPEFGLVVEIDGIHHQWAENVVDDALRHNHLALNRDVVLRIPVLGIRLQPDEFLDQIEQAINDRRRRLGA